MRRPLPAPLKALLGALIAALALAGVEGLLRIAAWPDPGLYEGDPASLWYLRPDLDREVPHPDAGSFRVQTNAAGLRGAAPPTRGPWTLALGCSTTFGWGVAEADAWPAQLAARIGEPVVNGGVPGWSTEQAVAGADRWLQQGPTRVILAYLVRDAWPADRPDATAAPTPWPLRTRLAALLRPQTEPSHAAPASLPSTPAASSRVPPDRFRDNLARLIAASGDAEVVLLAFPTRSPAAVAPWVERMRAAGPTLAPVLASEAFFATDPVHLTASGHGALAQAVAEGLRP